MDLCNSLQECFEDQIIWKKQAGKEEFIVALKDLVESSHTKYDKDDEIGECIHCGKISYKDHDKSCPWLKAYRLLTSIGISC